MQVLHQRTGTTKNGEEFGVLVVKPTGIIRPAKRTSLKDFLESTRKRSKKQHFIFNPFGR
jgi:hypothetical protein